MGEVRMVLELAAYVATAVGVILAVLQLYWGRKEASASRDLEITLHLAESFRAKWEATWRQTLSLIKKETSETGNISDEHQDDLLNMLNWIDWLGNLIDKGYLRNERVVFDAIAPQLREMLGVARSRIERGVSQHGREYWHGLLVVGQRLGVEWTKESA